MFLVEQGVDGYLRVLQCAFQALSSAKFPSIQEKFASSGLMHATLDTMTALTNGPGCYEHRDLITELCLTMPAELMATIPVLPRLIPCVSRALRGHDTLVALALRMLDLWAESFNPEFTEKNVAPLMKDVMAGLWSHLKPMPYVFGTKVVEILGKLGGRNRRWLLEGVEVDEKAFTEFGLRIILQFLPSTSFLVPLDNSIKLAKAALDKGGRGHSAFQGSQPVLTLANRHVNPVFSHSLPLQGLARRSTTAWARFA